MLTPERTSLTYTLTYHVPQHNTRQPHPQHGERPRVLTYTQVRVVRVSALSRPHVAPSCTRGPDCVGWAEKTTRALKIAK